MYNRAQSPKLRQVILEDQSYVECFVITVIGIYYNVHYFLVKQNSFIVATISKLFVDKACVVTKNERVTQQSCSLIFCGSGFVSSCVNIALQLSLF